jgi:FtsP/CotA-like multicopper oxidase with cupredoxin domain
MLLGGKATGVCALQVILVNGGVLSPMNVTVGDRVIVKVVNMLTVPISIHFHGILHHGTNTMDGVDSTTQRDVMPRGAQPLYA